MLCSLLLFCLHLIYKMCDNNNKRNQLARSSSKYDDSNMFQGYNNNCSPCSNDTIGCQAQNIRKIIANNLSILQCFKNIKCQVLAYINSVSAEFIQHTDHLEDALERERFNVLVESLIAGIHGSCRSFTNGQLEPYFSLYVQKYDLSENPVLDIGSGSSTDPVPDSGTLTPLYPNKISLFANCNKGNGIKGDEVLYYFIPTLLMLYDSDKSRLALKWGDASYTVNTQVTKKCLFPLLVNQDTFKWDVLELIPASNDSVWENRTDIYQHLRDDVLLGNADLIEFINKIDVTIRKCEITHSSLRLKLKMAAQDVIIDELDPTTNNNYW